MSQDESSFSRQVADLSKTAFPAAARRRLEPHVLSRADEEDLAQHAAAALLASRERVRDWPADRRAAYGMKALLNDVQDANERVAFKREVPCDPSPGDSAEGRGVFQSLAGEGNPEAAIVEGEQREALHEAIAQLSAEDREVLRLRFQDLSDAELASALGCGAEEARTRLRRAVEHLKKLLGETAR